VKDYYSLSVVQEDLFAGKITVEGLVLDYLKRIEEKKALNAFLEVFKESAISKAKAVDQEILAGKKGKLSGMVLAIKDNLCYKGHQVGASSKILSEFESLFSATAVQRLLDEGAVIIGRTNCDEFAMGSSNENSAFGTVQNPIDRTKVPGGSSGGSAAAVKAGMCLAALGSDTGGSIRQPASFCGLVGLKPTYGRVSRHGLIAYASSFDQIGPLTHTVEDAALLLEIMAGKDEFDSTLSSKPVERYGEGIGATPLPKKITFFKSYLDHPGLDPEVKARTLEVIESLRLAGHTVEGLDFHHLDHLVPTYYVLTTAEASSNLARYDGIHYGYRSQEAIDIATTYKKSRTEGFGPEVKRRIMLGTYVLSAGYYDAYYTKAQKVRRLLITEINQIFEQYDFILTPTSPHTAFEIGNQVSDPIKMYLEDIFTAHFNLTGHPAISLPLGKHSNGLPFGIQLVSPSYQEAELLSFADNLMNKSPLKI
jgi:aspartyl-tRNA(Asn)/glutamyl-tRNA(Gln) amidotransferase subunit A